MTDFAAPKSKRIDSFQQQGNTPKISIVPIDEVSNSEAEANSI